MTDARAMSMTLFFMALVAELSPGDFTHNVYLQCPSMKAMDLFLYDIIHICGSRVAFLEMTLEINSLLVRTL